LPGGGGAKSTVFDASSGGRVTESVLAVTVAVTCSRAGDANAEPARVSGANVATPRASRTAELRRNTREFFCEGIFDPSVR